MSFYSDFLDTVARENAIIRQLKDRLPAEQIRKLIIEQSPFNFVARRMKDARIVRVGAQQSQIFMETPLLEGQDYAQWFRLPFPSLYIQIDRPFPFTGYASRYLEDLIRYQKNLTDPSEIERTQVLIDVARTGGDPLIKGMLITEDAGDALMKATIEMRSFEQWCQEAGVDPSDVVRMISVAFLMPIPKFDLNLHGLTIAVIRNRPIQGVSWSSINTGTGAGLSAYGSALVTRPENAPGAAQPAIKNAIERWVVHLVNFMSSPSIKLIAREPSRELQKARQKRGKTPLPGWYELIWKKEVQDYTKDKFSQKKWEHSYRYDVRGHQRMYKKIGLVVWVRSHQRGLKHQIYKPAGRVIV